MEASDRRRVNVRRALLGGVALCLALLWMPPSTTASGRTLFVRKCGLCHGSGKEARAVNPDRFAALQWRNWFRREKHQRLKDIRGLVSVEEEKQILGYLTQKAADSDYPETAAIP